MLKRKKKLKNYFKVRKIIDSCETPSQLSSVIAWLMNNKRIPFILDLYGRAFRRYSYLCEVRDYLRNKESVEPEETSRFTKEV